jgi:hypothetical protein
LRRLAGIPPQDPPGPEDLGAEDLGVLPLPTIWPLAASLGVAMLFTGLIYGLWLVILGLGLIVYAAWGWLAAVNRENRYGRIQADTEAPSPQSGPVSDPDPTPARPGSPRATAVVRVGSRSRRWTAPGTSSRSRRRRCG